MRTHTKREREREREREIPVRLLTEVEGFDDKDFYTQTGAVLCLIGKKKINK
jgi:hypothetical protein